MQKHYAKKVLNPIHRSRQVRILYKKEICIRRQVFDSEVANTSDVRSFTVINIPQGGSNTLKKVEIKGICQFTLIVQEVGVEKRAWF